MLKGLLNRTTLNKNEMYLHKKRVEIAKLTPVKWKELFSSVDRLPGLIVQVLSAPQDDFYMTVIQGLDIALDEIVNVVSIMTEIDSDYIANNVGLDELAEYLQRMVKLNRLDSAVKNIKSLLPTKQ